MAGRDHARETLQRADVGDDADLRLADAEDGVAGGESDVTGGGDVDPAALLDGLADFSLVYQPAADQRDPIGALRAARAGFPLAR